VACGTPAGQTAPDIGTERVRTAARPSVLWPAAIAVLGVTADTATKAWAVSRLSGGRDIAVPAGVLRLQLVINHGASFGLGSGAEPLLAAVAFVAAILLGIWTVRASGRAESFGAALATAGATGNLIDRLFRAPSALHGGVVDWLHVSFYGPTFNLADLWLRAGLLIAIIAWLRRQSSRRRAA
jgi:signal peptidase II